MPETEPPATPSPEPDEARAPGAAWLPASLDDIDGATVRLLGKQGRFRPVVRLLKRDGAKLVAKDYRACTPLYRWTVGRWNLSKEIRALTRLAGLPGIPRVEARVGHWVLVLTWFRGKDLGKTPRVQQTPEFFDRLVAIVHAMHQRGVLHLDLRQRRNVLLQPDGHPAVLDFGASLCVRPGGLLVRLLGGVDLSGVLKYKHRAQPGSLTEHEADNLDRATRRRRWWPFG